MKSKKTVKKPRTKSAGQIAGRRIGCPGVGMFRLDQLKPADYDKSGDPTTPEYYTDVWELDYECKKRPADIDHLKVKPVEVFAIPMRVHTNTGCICYEPFCGSGSQIIAAEKLDRRCFAMEKEPVFVDVAAERWERWTGTKAKRERK